MKKIHNSTTIVSSKEIKVAVFRLDTDDKLINISRVYVITKDQSGKIPIIYNSKRNIWGFPGGHVEEGETIKQTAKRECIEEIKRSISNCTPKFLLLNKIDYKIEEKQIVCFAILGEKNDFLKDEDESVKKVEYLSLDDVKKKLGNTDLWSFILEDFSSWAK